MPKLMLSLLLTFAMPLMAFESLPEEYLVSYGKKNSAITITQYYSFTCPHCIALFRKQFQEIKELYIESDKVRWVFHPVPMDVLTVRAMDCLQKLSDHEKRMFLEVLLEEVVMDDIRLSTIFMEKSMEVLEKPVPNLQDKEYLSATDAFADAFEFIKQADKIEAVPSVDVNGMLLVGQIPDIDFVQKLLSKFGDATCNLQD